MTSRKGKRMLALTTYVAEHPGCTGAEVVRALGLPQRNGYASLERAVSAGLIRAERAQAHNRPQGVLTLWVPETSGGENLKPTNGSG
jgi:predicted transcriptional regulator